MVVGEKWVSALSLSLIDIERLSDWDIDREREREREIERDWQYERWKEHW